MALNKYYINHELSASVFLFTTWFAVVQGQDLDRLNQQLREAILQRQVMEEYGTDVKEAANGLTQC